MFKKFLTVLLFSIFGFGFAQAVNIPSIPNKLEPKYLTEEESKDDNIIIGSGLLSFWDGTLNFGEGTINPKDVAPSQDEVCSNLDKLVKELDLNSDLKEKTNLVIVSLAIKKDETMRFLVNHIYDVNSKIYGFIAILVKKDTIEAEPVVVLKMVDKDNVGEVCSYTVSHLKEIRDSNKSKTKI